MQHVRKTLFQRFLWVFVLLLIPFSLHHGQITQAQTDQEYLSEPYAIIEPEDGDIWKAGGRVTIRWRQTDFSVEDHDAKFKLIPDDSDKPERVIRQVSTDSDRDTQETTFTLPEYISPGSYQIIMIDAKEDPEYGEILDGWMEGRIQVVSAINIFRVIDPKHGDAATAGKRQTIRWNTEGSSTHVSISLYQSFLETKSGAVERVATIASNVSNDSEFTWTIRCH
ncbi:MAG: hypothetical protein UY09_C0045G0011 [Parcubacteria group bacterium GW2011_GWA2_47_8]|nr:MAG: hypothetical protein UY09_C0045G0011 [Parcubacteria group bacterium GW2011_GWA2_47_8]